MENNKNLLIGYHCNASKALNGEPEFFEPARRSPVDFILVHTDPAGGSVADDCRSAEKTAQICKELGVEFIANFEKQNFVDSDISTDGHDWANHPDGTHRLDVPVEYITALNSRGNCRGIMYDEFEHVIINRNLSIGMATKFKRDLPVFPLPDTRDPVRQMNILDEQLNKYAGKLKNDGAETVSGEHVFPVLFHLFAKNGIIPNFKSQKESASDIQFACAAGAALEYGTPLWNCVDLWYRMTFPGHSPGELYNNLKFAYLSGVNRVYPESSSVFFDADKRYNEYGYAFSRFTDEYRGTERGYDISDYRPETGIIHADDTFWGQGSVIPYMWRNMLFGNPAIKPDRRAKEWIKIFRLITHGETGRGGISWDRIDLWSLRRHRSFVTMNSAAVFDENVKKETLSSLKLIFICGYTVSTETLEAVKELVCENGLTAVCPARFAPEEILSRLKHGGKGEVKSGNGTWIITDNFGSRSLKKRLAPLLGKKGEIRLTFRDRVIRLKISENGEAFTEI